MQKNRIAQMIIVSAIFGVLFFFACGEHGGGGAPALESPLRLATTTSTENSGLLAHLLPTFTRKFGVDVDVAAVGTGKALKLGEKGDVDLVLVHARKAEDEFVEKGFGVNRRDVMYNDFIIIGPSSDPAGVREEKDVASGLKKIASKGATFVSRGDDSGTHKKELMLWKAAQGSPPSENYLETGQGMGETLNISNEKQAYCLVDRGTYLAYSEKIDLTVLVEGDERLYNPYGVIAVSPARHSHVKYHSAMALIGWMTSEEGQRIIDEFKVGRKKLFHPMAVPSKNTQ